MSLVQKLHDAVIAQFRVITTAAVFGIGLAITAVVGSVIGVLAKSDLAYYYKQLVDGIEEAWKDQ